MTLPSSGSIGANDINLELGRSATAGFSMDGTAERALAGKPSGSISFSDFHGKSSEIVKTLAAGGSAITLESLFTAAEWTSDTQKRVILPAGVERGNSASTTAAISIGPTAWGGTLIFDVSGTISGKGGAANSGVGGDAFQANRVGNANQKLVLNLLSGSVLRGGGGGGGKGGQGGNGGGTQSVRYPASGDLYRMTSAPWSYWVVYIMEETDPAWGLRMIDVLFENTDYPPKANWGGQGSSAPTSLPSNTESGVTYYRGTLRTGNADNGEYGVYRVTVSNVSTTGGTGGDGGRGEGYGQTRAAGSAGAAGGTNAGTGGTGGTGGLYGASGATGATGSNGNSSNGLAGSAGGLAGYGLLGSANVILNNNGSILGRTG